MYAEERAVFQLFLYPSIPSQRLKHARANASSVNTFNPSHPFPSSPFPLSPSFLQPFLELNSWGYNTAEERALAASHPSITYLDTEQALLDYVKKRHRYL